MMIQRFALAAWTGIALAGHPLLAAIDGGEITEVIVQEALVDGQMRATLLINDSQTVVHPVDGLLTCTLYSDNKGSIALARVARVKGFEVDIEYSAPETDSECWVDTLTLGNRIEVTP